MREIDRITIKSNEQGVCPYCNSYAINYGKPLIEGDDLGYPATCTLCGRRFTEWYNLVFISQYVLTDEYGFGGERLNEDINVGDTIVYVTDDEKKGANE